MNKKLIYNGTVDYGIVGDYFGDDILRIGDVVSFMYNRRIHTSVIVKPSDIGYAIVYGFGSVSFDVLFKEGYSLAVTHLNVHNEVLNFLTGSLLEVKEEKPVNLTLRDIEVILGYPVNIIGE